VSTTDALVDVETITAEARDAAVTELAEIPDLHDRLTRAAEVTNEASAALADAREGRDRLLLSLNVYDRVRGLPKLAGIAPTTLFKIRKRALGTTIPKREDNPLVRDPAKIAQKAKRMGVPRVPKDEALEALPRYVRDVATAKGRIAGALMVRDAALEALVESGEYTRMDLARIMGRDRSRVTHLLARRERSDD
jgi:hypothetical protein